MRTGVVLEGRTIAPPAMRASSNNSHGIWSGRKSGLYGIADDLEPHAMIGLDRRPEQREVAVDGSRHSHSIGLPQRGIPLDVGEEKNDRS
jgi:hypothetical protein